MLASFFVAVLAFVLAAYAGAGDAFNPDESRWISRAHYFGDLADPFGATWADQYMTRGQPPLGSYAMGLGLTLQGRDLETNPPWDFSVTWEENIALGNKPVPEDLAAGRRTSAALVAVTALGLIAVARIFVPMPWAIAAGVLFAIHPFTVYIGSIAMSDALFGLFITLAAWAAAEFARKPSGMRAALVGILLGLGGATKLSPLAVAAGLCLASIGLFFLVVARGRPRPHSRRACAMAMFGIVALLASGATFFAVYPYLWPDPLDRTRNLFAFRVEEMATQASDWPVMAVPTRAEALRRMGINFTERYSLSSSLASLAGGAVPAPVRLAEFGLALVGVALMSVMAIRDGPYGPRTLAFAVLAVQVAVTILGMRSEFDRYHLPMALLGAVAAAVTLERVARGLRNLNHGSPARVHDDGAPGPLRNPARGVASGND